MSTMTTGGQLVLPGQTAAPDGPVDLIGMWVMHFAFRRDLDAFSAAAVATPATDRAAWRAMEARWRQFATALHHHHTGEDIGLWPLLLAHADARGDAAARETLEAMEAEHGEIDPLLASCAAGFARLAGKADEDERAALAVRVTALRERLAHHLQHEECGAMPLVQAYLTEADWERLDREAFRPQYALRDVVATLPWVLHRLPVDARRRMFTGVGGQVTVAVSQLLLRRGFERRERVAFRHVTQSA